MFLPDGEPVAAGTRIVMGDYAASLRLIQAQGDAALHGGALGRALAQKRTPSTAGVGGTGAPAHRLTGAPSAPLLLRSETKIWPIARSVHA